MLAILQILTKFIITSGIIFVFAFMVICTVFVIAALIHGDIRIKMFRDSDEKNM